jgi:hypothetical protein
MEVHLECTLDVHGNTPIPTTVNKGDTDMTSPETIITLLRLEKKLEHAIQKGDLAEVLQIRQELNEKEQEKHEQERAS